MSATQHTPGPWTKVDKWNIAGNNGGSRGRYVCSVCDWSTSPTSYVKENASLKAESQANARLIASAPDMLAALYASEIALRSVLRQNVQVDAAFEQVRAAIARATGAEGEGAK